MSTGSRAMRVLRVVVAMLALAMPVACGSSSGAAVLAPHPGGAVATVMVPVDPATMPHGVVAPTVPPELDELVEDAGPGLVNVYTYRTGRLIGSGTGIVLNSRGLVVTNAHVTARGDTFLAQDNGDARTYRAVLMGADSTHDVAALQMQNARNLHVIPRSDSNQLRLGDRIASMGNAYGQGRLWIGAGQITRLNVTTRPTPTTELPGMIEALTDIRPGESGGAMITTKGTVIGMNQGAGSVNGWDKSAPNGYGYGIPINTVVQVVNRLLGEN